MSTVRNKSMNAKAREFGNPTAHWLKVAHRGDTYYVPSSGYWKFAEVHASDDLMLYRKISDAIRGALSRTKEEIQERADRLSSAGTRVLLNEHGETLGEELARWNRFLDGEITYEEFKRGPE